METMELKPCPFCGGSPVFLDVNYHFTVKCDFCDCLIDREFKTKEAAAEAWNRREEHYHEND